MIDRVNQSHALAEQRRPTSLIAPSAIAVKVVWCLGLANGSLQDARCSLVELEQFCQHKHVNSSFAMPKLVVSAAGLATLSMVCGQKLMPM